MQIVIIGAGEVGFHAGKALSESNHDITAVDIVPEKCTRLSENLDVIVVEGNGASPKILHQANVENADYVLGLTRVDEVNLIAAQQAHELGANIELHENMAIINGVDHLIGAPVMSTDIRASAALILGAIMARGKTDISRIYHIDRGYEFIEKKFQALGVDIVRKND